SFSFPVCCPSLPFSTLFPYTTLFRSTGAETAPATRRAARAMEVFIFMSLSFSGQQGNRTAHRTSQGTITAPHGVEILELTQRVTDRKSTRLNSSHVKISYAVFCFIKK